MTDPFLPRDPLVLRRMSAPIPGGQSWWAAEYLPMVPQGGRQLGVLGGLILQDREAGNDAALHLVEDHQPPELHLRAALVPGDDPGVRLEAAASPFCLASRCSSCSPRRTLRSRVRKASRTPARCSPTSGLLRRMTRLVAPSSCSPVVTTGLLASV